MNIYEYLINQLDELSEFQKFASDMVYSYIKKSFPLSVTNSNIYILSKFMSFESYKGFYNKSLLLLGVAYYEGFVYDLLDICQKTNPSQRQDIPNKYIDKVKRLKKLGFDYDDNDRIVHKGFLIRNCFAHNNGLVSDKLNKSFNDYIIGEPIIVTDELLDQLGRKARVISEQLWNYAIKKYGVN